MNTTCISTFSLQFLCSFDSKKCNMPRNKLTLRVRNHSREGSADSQATVEFFADSLADYG